MSSDEELLGEWRAGDPRAGEALFQRHFEAVRRFFVNKAGDAAEDLIQKTFIGCVEAKERFAGRSSFKTFLFAIANNVVREHYRRRMRGTEDLDDVSVADLEPGPGPASLIAEHQEQRILLRALRTIALDLQIVVELYFWEKLNAREIGEILEIPENTARSRLRRAKEALEEAIGRLSESPDVLLSTTGDLEKWAAGIRCV